jgi:transcriptional regulator with XRE-family HTH domain
MSSKRPAKRGGSGVRAGFEREGAFGPNIGIRVRNARKRLDWTQDDLSEEADISLDRLKNLEAGNFENPATVRAILKVLNPLLEAEGLSPIEWDSPESTKAETWLSLPIREWDSESCGPGALLNADFQVVDFHGEKREVEVDRLLRWCRLEQEANVRIYKGGAGMGKTRLALELCKRLGESTTDPWTVGFADPNRFPLTGNPWTRICDLHQPLLIVVDYAGDDQKTKFISRLLQESQRCPAPRLRLLCLDRDDLWLGRLRDREQRLFDSMRSQEEFIVDLRPMASTLAEREETFRIAATEFAKRLKVSLPKPLTARLGGSDYNQVLVIHMKALLAVLGAEPPNRLTGIVLHVLKRERDFWIRQLEARGLPRMLLSAVETAVYCVTENGGVETLTKAEKLIRREPLLQDQPALVLSQIALLLRECYPLEKNGIAPLQPDLLRDALRDEFLRASGHKGKGV